jgi:S1-C subfamily serine protease
VPFDDDAEADHPGFRPPPHPDDRLWRHPSEMNAHPIVPLGAPGAPSVAVRTSDGQARTGRPWGAVVVAGTAGAVLAGAGVLALGIGERVVERPVTERVALNPMASALGSPDADTLDGVRQRVAPAVVGIVAAGAVPGQGEVTGGEGAVAGQGEVTGSEGAVPGQAEVAGSGVVVRDDGIVVTSAALVATGSVPGVRLPDGTVVAAELVGSDLATGLAVLDLAGGGYTPSVLATVGDLMAGEPSFAVSARLAGGTTTAAGVVGLARRYLGPLGGALDGIEVAGEADPLAIGGPLVDPRGAVVGITTAVEDGDAWYVAPVEVAHKVADGLLTDGVVQHCWLGIEGTDVAAGAAELDTAESPAAGSVTGAGTRVASVVPGSPAALGGLRPGDVVVALDGQTIARMPDLIVALRARSPGDRVDVTVTRDDGSRATLVLTLAEAPAPAPAQP